MKTHWKPPRISLYPANVASEIIASFMDSMHNTVIITSLCISHDLKITFVLSSCSCPYQSHPHTHSPTVSHCTEVKTSRNKCFHFKALQRTQHIERAVQIHSNSSNSWKQQQQLEISTAVSSRSSSSSQEQLGETGHSLLLLSPVGSVLMNHLAHQVLLNATLTNWPLKKTN